MNIRLVIISQVIKGSVSTGPRVELWPKLVLTSRTEVCWKCSRSSRVSCFPHGKSRSKMARLTVFYYFSFLAVKYNTWDLSTLTVVGKSINCSHINFILGIMYST